MTSWAERNLCYLILAGCLILVTGISLAMVVPGFLDYSKSLKLPECPTKDTAWSGGTYSGGTSDNDNCRKVFPWGLIILIFVWICIVSGFVMFLG